MLSLQWEGAWEGQVPIVDAALLQAGGRHCGSCIKTGGRLAKGKIWKAGTDECVGECVSVCVSVCVCVCVYLVGFGQASSSRLEEDMATHSSVLAWKSHVQRSLAGYSPWGCKEMDMPEATEHAEHIIQKMQEAGKMLHESPL